MIFSDMEFFGLGKFKNTKIMEKNEKKQTSAPEDVVVDKTFKETDYIFDKSYECPICDYKFIAKSVKASRLRVVSKDTDLRPIYEGIDPIKYEVITCNACGYSGLIRYFGRVSSSQIKRLREEVQSSFRGMDVSRDTITYDDAIIRYKFALICSKVKYSKWSEKAYTFLKLGWIYRGKRQEITQKDITDEFTKEGKIKLIKELYEFENECMEQAYEGFKMAYSSEQIPICGMDDSTFSYLVADLARRAKDYRESMKYLEKVIISKTASQRIKDEALKIRDLVKEEIKKSGVN